MEQFFENPGLQHIGETIFQQLDINSLVQCRRVKKSWKVALDNPRFWLKLCTKKALIVQPKFYNKWKELIHNNEESKDEITKLLMKMCKIWKEESPRIESLKSPFQMSVRLKDVVFIEKLLNQQIIDQISIEERSDYLRTLDFSIRFLDHIWKTGNKWKTGNILVTRKVTDLEKASFFINYIICNFKTKETLFLDEQEYSDCIDITYTIVHRCFDGDRQFYKLVVHAFHVLATSNYKAF